MKITEAQMLVCQVVLAINREILSCCEDKGICLESLEVTLIKRESLEIEYSFELERFCEEGTIGWPNLNGKIRLRRKTKQDFWYASDFCGEALVGEDALIDEPYAFDGFYQYNNGIVVKLFADPKKTQLITEFVV